MHIYVTGHFVAMDCWLLLQCAVVKYNHYSLCIFHAPTCTRSRLTSSFMAAVTGLTVLDYDIDINTAIHAVTIYSTKVRKGTMLNYLTT